MGASISAYLEGRTLGSAGIVDELEQDSTKEQSRSSREARLLAGTTAGGERHAATHSSWSGERSLEAELEYQSTLASLALVEEPERSPGINNALPVRSSTSPSRCAWVTTVATRSAA